MPRNRRRTHTPEQIEQLRSMAANKRTATEIARELGVTRATAKQWAIAHRITLVTHREAMATVWADPARQEQQRQIQTERMSKPEMRQSVSRALRETRASDDSRRQRSEISKAMWADPEKRTQLRAAISEGMLASEKRPLPTIEEREQRLGQAKQWLEEGRTLTWIGAQWGVTQSAASSYLRRHGLIPGGKRLSVSLQRSMTLDSRLEQARGWLAERRSLAWIGHQWGVTQQAVSAYLKKHGMTTSRRGTEEHRQAIRDALAARMRH